MYTTTIHFANSSTKKCLHPIAAANADKNNKDDKEVETINNPTTLAPS